MRMLFVTWNDGYPPAQFSVPDDCTLEQISSEPVALGDTGAELLLDAQRVRSAYLIDVPANTMIASIEAVPVEEQDEALTQVDWPTPDEHSDPPLVDTELIARYAEPYE